MSYPQLPVGASLQPERSKKRQRVSVACQACRTKRMRCDGIKPTCGACTKREIACIYQQGESKRKPPSKRYVESLHTRIRLLEAELISHGKYVSALNNRSGEASDGDSDSEHSDASEDNEVAESQQRDPLEEVTNMVGRLNVGEDGQFRFFGSQSNFHLLHGHMDAMAPHLSSKAQENGLSAVSKLDKQVSISDELQDHLLELYWRWQNPWGYVVHKAAFLEDFRTTKSGKYCTPLLLSAIFALASRYSDRVELRTDPNDPSTAGDAFSEQSRILLLYESEAATTTTVQAAALMSLRAMSENREARGWLYSGMATRMAFNLGLNLDCSDWVKSGLLSDIDFEVRNVSWWGCYALDKLFAIGLGRPGTTRGCDITCPKPTRSQDAEFEAWVPWKNCDSSSLLGVHTRVASTASYICDNLDIATEALDQIYAPNSKLSRKGVQNIVAKADVALNEFYTALPSYLRLPSSSRAAALPHVYQLHIQYHVTQILLHRPLIVKRRAGPALQSPTSSDTNSHMQTCRHSAAQVAKLLRAYRYHYTLRLIPIVTVHNTFTAAITHLIDALSNEPSIKRQGLRCLQTCVGALQEMSIAWSWSSRALRALKLLANEWMLADEIKQPQRSQEDVLHSAPNDIPEAPIVKPPEPQTDDAAPELARSVFGDGSGSLDTGSTMANHDISWLFDPASTMDLDGMERIENQAQMNMWLLDAAQSTFATSGWNWDGLSTFHDDFLN